MTVWTSAAPSVLASFMASTVEVVEALTIVLAVGLVRGWRSALMGVGAALAALVAMIAVFGPWLTRIPLPVVQLVVGTLLLLFGLRWLRKAILRAAGVLALHDEAKAFEAETTALRAHGLVARRGFDRLAFSTAFKIVMLEGIEVVFIVIAIGASGHMIVPASIGALLALLMVVLLGFILHKPLARVPENTLKLGVGVLLAAFGTFWVGEGLGLPWPGADASILALAAVFFAVAIGLVAWCRALRQDAHARRSINAVAAPQTKASGSPRMGAIAASGRVLWGLFFDDGLLAAGTLVWVAVAWTAQRLGAVGTPQEAALFASGLILILAASAARRAHRA